MEWSKAETKNFIELYRQKSLIWDPQDPNYFNKIKKKDAWVEIAEEIGRPLNQCKKKMENLLASLRREKMKMKRYMSTGHVYASSWFAFKSLKFILDKNKTNQASLNNLLIQEEELICKVENESVPEDGACDSVAEEEIIVNVQNSPQNVRNEYVPLRYGKRAKLTTSNGGDFLQQAVVDECFHFGNFIASKLRGYDECTRCNIQYDILQIFKRVSNNHYTLHEYPVSNPTPGSQNHSSTTATMPQPRISTPSEMLYDSQNPLPSPQESTDSNDLYV